MNFKKEAEIIRAEEYAKHTERQDKPYKQMRAFKATHKLVATYAVANEIELTPALDKLVRLGLKADKAGKGGKKK